MNLADQTEHNPQLISRYILQPTSPSCFQTIFTQLLISQSILLIAKLLSARRHKPHKSQISVADLVLRAEQFVSERFPP
jgi:hypothetical protein